MAKLLFGVHGLRGSLNNTVALAKQLVAEGHDVTVAAFRDIEADVRSSGANFVYLSDGPRAAEAFSRAYRARRFVRALTLSRSARRELLQLTQARELLREIAPDLAVIDMEMHGLVLSARAESTPTLLSIPWHDVFYDQDRPPMHTELLPGSSLRRRLRIRAAWQMMFLNRQRRRVFLLRSWRESVDRMTAWIAPFQLNTSHLATLRAMAQTLGLDLDDFSSPKHWMKPHVYTHAPVLSFTSQALELDPNATHRVVHVGPMIDPDRRASAEAVASVDRFAASAAQRGCSIGYCSMGSLQAANLAYYQAVIAAFERLDDWVLILGLGGQGGTVSLGDSHDDLLILDEAPQLQILDHADVAIHPGGTGTFYECVKSATPSLVIHTGHVDMPGIAARVNHHQLGVSLDRDVAAPEAVAAAVLEITTSAAIRTSLAHHRGVVATYERDRAAISLIERQLS